MPPAPLVGATVKATYIPSGTVYTTTTQIEGIFSIQNMRSGAPYTFEITYAGYDPKVVQE